MKIILTVFLSLAMCFSISEASSNTHSSNNSEPLSIKSLNLKPNEATGRWYNLEIVAEGEQIFNAYCASCHGKKAESIQDWKTSDDNGLFPPPPLNGTAHAWHHPLVILDQVISEGGLAFGGVMPAWKGILSEDQRLKAIASFQQYWSDETYAKWLSIELSIRGVGKK